MKAPFRLTRIATLKSVADFRNHCASLGIELPCDDASILGPTNPLVQPVTTVKINGKQIGNRWAIHPMEGWDATTSGGATDDVRRRWQRFGESGAKLIYGGEAMAVRPDGRANPNQLILSEANLPTIAELPILLAKAHQERLGTTADLVIGFQLTHSGRFCKPNDKERLEPRVAYRHPILDQKFGVVGDDQVFTDDEIERLIEDFIRAAKIAWNAGADFIDIKHCHGYLLHEFLSAHSYLQEYLPNVAQYTVRNGWTDMVGLGRMVLSYPEILSDAVTSGVLAPKRICRTFSDCTTAPRNGLVSGCYPLDKYYSGKPEFQKLKEAKRQS